MTNTRTKGKDELDMSHTETNHVIWQPKVS